VDRDRQLVLVAQHDRGDEVLIEGVHAAVPEQAHEVECGTASLHAAAQLDERRQAEELSRLDRLRDAHDVLGHHASGAEIQVSDLAVTDLSGGESHREPRGVEQCARRFGPEAVPGARVTQLDGVSLAAGTEAPAIEHDQDDRGARPIPLRHI